MTIRLDRFDEDLELKRESFLDDLAHTTLSHHVLPHGRSHKLGAGATARVYFGPPDDLMLERTAQLWAGLRRVYFGEIEDPTDSNDDKPKPRTRQTVLDFKAEISETRARIRRRAPRLPDDLNLPPTVLPRPSDDDPGARPPSFIPDPSASPEEKDDRKFDQTSSMVSSNGEDGQGFSMNGEDGSSTNGENKQGFSMNGEDGSSTNGENTFREPTDIRREAFQRAIDLMNTTAVGGGETPHELVYGKTDETLGGQMRIFRSPLPAKLTDSDRPITHWTLSRIIMPWRF
jgi:hypothetical protein